MQFIQVLSGLGAGKQGSQHGVKWLCQRHNISPQQSIIFQNRHSYQLTDPPAKYIDNLTAFFNEFLPTLSQQFQKPHFPIILSGDHSNAIGIISALCNAYPDKRIGVIWIDAHADFHTPFTTPSGNLHGMSLAALTRQDNFEKRTQQPDPRVLKYWQMLKELAPKSKGISPSDLCFLGLRDYEPEEQALIEQFQIPHFSAEKMREIGFDTVLEQVKQQFSALDMVYLSFDVDSLDDSLFSATGTPVPQGFNEQELNQILKALLHIPNLKAFELTEFNPSLSDSSEQYDVISRLFGSVLENIRQ